MEFRLTTARARVALYGCAALLGLGHFLIAVHWSFALASSAKWRNPGGDEVQMLMGVIALLRDHWHFPLTDTALLSFGPPSSIVFTDSVPWLSVLVKALGLGPDQVSVLGLIVLLSFILQPVAMALLLRALGVRRLEILLAGMVLGAMLPAWYLREGGHLALASHWLLVLALAIAVHAIRRGVGNRVIAAATLLGVLALGVHAYLFVMVSAVLLPALLADLFRPRARSLGRAAAGVAIYLLGQALASVVLGYWGGTASGSGFGLYSMNLLSLFVPQRSGLRELLTGDGGPIVDGTGGAQWEGFNYLGAGLFLVLIAAAVALFTRRARPPSAPVLRAALPLVASLLVLTCLAISNQVYFGHILLLRIPLSPGMERLLGVVRSSGRLFWPVSYLLLGVALAVLARSRMRVLIAGVLAAAVVLQVIDTIPLRRDLRGVTAPRPEPFVLATSPWAAPPLRGSAVRLLPNFDCAAPEDLDAMRQLGLLVLRNGGQVDGVPSARTPPDACARSLRLAAALPENPAVVNVLFAHSLPAVDLFRAALSGQCVRFAAGLACGARAIGSSLPRASASAQVPGKVVPLGKAVLVRKAKDDLSGGWKPGAGGAWTDGSEATLLLRLAAQPAEDLILQLHACGYVPAADPTRVQLVIRANGERVAAWDVGSAETVLTARIPASDVAPGGGLAIDLRIGNPRTPADHPDARRGILVHDFTLDSASGPAMAEGLPAGCQSCSGGTPPGCAS